MMRRWKQWGITVLALFTLGLVVACHGGTPTVSGRSADCTPVDHVAGTTCVPNQPQRVVALDSKSLEHLLSLGIKPIGATFSGQLDAHLQQDVTEIENIGSVGEPNLERIVALQPDLIIGEEDYQRIYPQSSQIAPTILYEFEHSGQWKDIFMNVAKMLQKTEIAEQVMNDYNTRLAEFKQRMGDRLEKTKASVVRIYPDSIDFYTDYSFCGTILQDAELQRPEAQVIAVSEVQKQFNNEARVSIPFSRELLPQMDGDVMFVWTGENTPEANQQAQQKLAELESDPLWQELNVVQQNTIYQVPSYWLGSGMIAANAIIDDLFKYLIESPQS